MSTGKLGSDRVAAVAKNMPWGASQIYDILQLEFGLDPQQPLNVYVYQCERLTEFICQAVWRDAADVDLCLLSQTR